MSEIEDILENDFDWWSTIKSRTNSRKESPFFRAGEVWIAQLGLNVGIENNGKGSRLLRPIVILKKYNDHSFLSAPLTTSPKRNDFRISIGKVSNKDAAVIISQLRCLDSKRLLKKICVLDNSVFIDIKRKASEIIFR